MVEEEALKSANQLKEERGQRRARLYQRGRDRRPLIQNALHVGDPDILQDCVPLSKHHWIRKRTLNDAFCVL